MGKVRRHLQQQAFLQVAAAHTGRIQSLQCRQRPGQILRVQGRVVRLGQLFQAAIQQALLVDGRDQISHPFQLLGWKVQEAQLLLQVVMQIGWPRGDVRHHVQMAVSQLFHAGARGSGFIVKIPVVPAHQVQALKIRLALHRVHPQHAQFRIPRFSLRWLPLVKFLLTPGNHLQHGVLLHLPLDPFLQGLQGHLQDLHGLDHPRTNRGLDSQPLG